MVADVSDGAKLRAVALWKFADKTGYCWPNQDQLEQAIGHRCTARTSHFVKELRERGWLDLGYVAREGVRKSANYQLCYPGEELLNVEGVQ